MEKLQLHCQSVTIVSWKWCLQQHCGLEIRQVTLLWLKRVNPNYPFSFHGLCLPDIIWNSYIGYVTLMWLEYWMCNNIVAWKFNLVRNNIMAWKFDVQQYRG